MMFYIGPDKVKSTEEMGDMVKVVFENKEIPVFLKKKMYDKSISLSSETATELRTRRLQPIMEDVVKVLMDWDVKICEVEPLFMSITDFLNDKISYASAKLWWSNIKNQPDPKRWHHNEITFERTIGDLNGVFEDGGKGENQSDSPLSKDESGTASK